MSADSYGFCPVCKGIPKKEKDGLEKLITGLQSMSQDDTLPEDHRDCLVECKKDYEKKLTPVESLREYHSYNAQKYVLYIDYSCRCDECGYEFNYTNKVDMPIKENE